MQPLTFQQMILRLSQYWAEQGCVILQPYDIEVGAGTFHPATHAARARPGAVAHGVRPAVAAAHRRPLRREPEPAAALLPVPGHPQAVPGRRAGAVLRLAARDRHRARRARRPLRRGRLGVADARRVGARLGGVARRHGGHAVHVLPAGRRHRAAGPCPRRSPTASSASPCTSRASTASTTSTWVDGVHATATSSSATRSSTRRTTSRWPTPRCCSEPVRHVRGRVRAARSTRASSLPAYDYVLKCSHAFNLLDARGAIAVTERVALHRPRACAREGVRGGVLAGVDGASRPPTRTHACDRAEGGDAA